jgi:c-di-GMP-binding flagellar brake protein YcgR
MTYEGERNRRKNSRFPIVREIRYRVASRENLLESGAGATVNISSGGVLFTTEKPLVPGRRIEVAISWPAELNRNTALKLVARGRVVRVEDDKAAAEIHNFEFRTAGLTGGSKPTVIPFRDE